MRPLPSQSIAVRVYDVGFPSVALGKLLTYRIFVPTNAGPRVPVLYLLHGLGGSYADWADQTDVATLTQRVPLIALKTGDLVGKHELTIRLDAPDV